MVLGPQGHPLILILMFVLNTFFSQGSFFLILFIAQKLAVETNHITIAISVPIIVLSLSSAHCYCTDFDGTYLTDAAYSHISGPPVIHRNQDSHSERPEDK